MTVTATISSQETSDRLVLTDIERKALEELAKFPLTAAIFHRRSRRFPRGGHIPDGTLAYKSRFKPEPLSELERLLR